MSNLNSIFDILGGWPNGSALGWNFKQKSGVTPDIPEGTIVDVEDDGTGKSVIDRYTSVATASGNLDTPWVVIQGKDQFDSKVSTSLTCVRLRTGFIFRVPTTETPLVGALVWGNAGVLTAVDPGAAAPALGKVLEFSPSGGWMTVES